MTHLTLLTPDRHPVDATPGAVASHDVEEVVDDFASLLSVFAHLDDVVLLGTGPTHRPTHVERWMLHAVRTLWSDRSRGMRLGLERLTPQARRTRLKYDLSTPWYQAERRLRAPRGCLLERAISTHEVLASTFATLASDVVSDEVRELFLALAREERRSTRILARLDHEICHAV